MSLERKDSIKILSIGREITYSGIDIVSIKPSQLSQEHDIESYSHVIINGGDGMVRRVLKQLHTLDSLPKFILNPIGSFNVVAKIHRVSSVDRVLERLSKGIELETEKHHIFRLNDEIFLFSAGNMGDLQHILLSETFRFGWLKYGISKYILSAIFLLPAHIVMTPFMLLSSERFFIFTPIKWIKKFGNFYGEVEDIHMELHGDHNMIELDGDLVTIYSKYIDISKAGYFYIVV